MASTLSQSEEAQLAQTIEMFEVITQSQPNDYQSLEILKEAYSKLGRENDVIGTSKRIAQAYVQMGQFSSAILEYETILQRHPNDPDVQAA
ncbi:MAG: tetratricopeptide repeat protein, partial [Verrucomicrobiota bacterium]